MAGRKCTKGRRSLKSQQQQHQYLWHLANAAEKVHDLTFKCARKKEISCVCVCVWGKSETEKDHHQCITESHWKCCVKLRIPSAKPCIWCNCKILYFGDFSSFLRFVFHSLLSLSRTLSLISFIALPHENATFPFQNHFLFCHCQRKSAWLLNYSKSL